MLLTPETKVYRSHKRLYVKSERLDSTEKRVLKKNPDFFWCYTTALTHSNEELCKIFRFLSTSEGKGLSTVKTKVT